MDRLTRAQRSKVMARVRSKNTQPEKRVRALAHTMGLRFRLHRRDLKGTPDLVFPKYKTAVFVHGCFWHQHPGCKRATMPLTRKEFWRSKLARNIERDMQNQIQLKSEGWRVVTVWECKTKNLEELTRRLEKIFFGPRSINQKTARVG